MLSDCVYMNIYFHFECKSNSCVSYAIFLTAMALGKILAIWYADLGGNADYAWLSALSFGYAMPSSRFGYTRVHIQAIHYAMPLRNMIYDALSLLARVRMKQAEHLQNNDLQDADEFLSRFSRTDRIDPVVTLVIYDGLNPH